MVSFEDYAKKYKSIVMERSNGILEMRLHTESDSFRWSALGRSEITDAFLNIAQDRQTRVVIVTGTGAEFSGPKINHTDDHWVFDNKPATPESWDLSSSSDERMIMSILNVDVPMICAVNGPARRHCEVALLCDVVLASDDASFEDTAHFHPGMRVPGDGLSIVLMHLMGLNRARHMMFTGQVLSAKESKDVGLVGEVLPKHQVMERARSIANQLIEKPDLTLRYTRQIFVRELKRQMHDTLGFGLALEGLAKIDLWMKRRQ